MSLQHRPSTGVCPEAEMATQAVEEDGIGAEDPNHRILGAQPETPLRGTGSKALREEAQQKLVVEKSSTPVFRKRLTPFESGGSTVRLGLDAGNPSEEQVKKHGLHIRSLLDQVPARNSRGGNIAIPVKLANEISAVIHRTGFFTMGHRAWRNGHMKALGLGLDGINSGYSHTGLGDASEGTRAMKIRSNQDHRVFELVFDSKGLRDKPPTDVLTQEPSTHLPSIGPGSVMQQSSRDVGHERASGTARRPVLEDVKARPAERRARDDDRDVPLSVPYTTAASEFLYGSNVVLAALRGKRRKLYHMYLHPRAFNRETNANELLSLAKAADVPTDRDANLRLLDKMADNRAHNGVVLEASKIPAPPALSLAKPDTTNSIIPLRLDRQSIEDISVNGAPLALPLSTNSWRQPCVVMLDGIVDPGNLGNILRSAHFYGIDAVAVATNTCANLSSAVLAKASSGACEAVQLLALPRPADFVLESAKAGWRVYAAVAPQVRTTARNNARQTTTTAVAANSPLRTHPCLLMLGAEGEGLRANLVNKADYLLGIERGEQGSEGVDVGVDSLNVAVAAGVLMEAFMRKPANVSSTVVPAARKAARDRDEKGVEDGVSSDLGF